MLIAHTYAYANCYSESYGDGDSHTNNNPDTYAKAFTHAAASARGSNSSGSSRRIAWPGCGNPGEPARMLLIMLRDKSER